MSKVYTVEFAGSDSVLFIIVTVNGDGRSVLAVGNYCGLIASKVTNDSVRHINDIGTRERFVETLVETWHEHDCECSVDGGPMRETRGALLAVANVLFGE